MTDLPYTYTDVNGTRLTVAQGLIGLTVENKGAIHFHLPTGEDAVRLARAVLAAAGDTGHEVIPRATYTLRVRQAFQEGARSMRERAALRLEDDLNWTEAEQIRALPLISDGDTVAPPTVHVATPEGITPCGRGHHDVTVSAFIDEATCVECLRATAIQKADQVIEVRRERDRLRTAWESARRGRTQARAQLADARRYVRILGEQRADLRKQVSAAETRLPEDDTVDPDDQAPSLESRVEALEQKVADLGETNIRSTELLTERIAQMERDAESAETRVDNLHAADGALARLAALEQQYRLHRRFTAQDDG